MNLTPGTFLLAVVAVTALVVGLVGCVVWLCRSGRCDD